MAVPISNLTSIWTNSSQTYNAMVMDAISTGHSSESKLLDLRLNNISQFSVDPSGKISANNIGASEINVTKLTSSGGSMNASVSNIDSLNAAALWVSTGNLLVNRTIDSTIGLRVKLDVNGAANASTYYDDAGSLRDIPINNQTSAYVFLATDVGKTISITTGGVTVPNAIFVAGDAISIYNNSAVTQAITAASDVTLRLAGSAYTGNRNLATYGLATALCVAANTFVISGAGLT